MIKVTVGKQKTQEEIPFPKLMEGTGRYDGSIVFFESKGRGQLLKTGGDGLHIAACCTNWPMENFEDFTGKITLQNVLP